MLDENFETKVLACLYRSSEFCAVACQHLKAKYFESSINHNMCKMSLDFYGSYKTTISKMGFVDGVKKLLDKKVILSDERKLYLGAYKRLYEEDIRDHKYALDKLISFISQQEYKLFIEKCVTKYLPDEDFEKIKKESHRIGNISAIKEVEPTSYMGNIDKRYERREGDKKSKIKGITTGVDPLDEVMGYRGWVNGELYAVAGSAKSGKSQALVYFANTASLYGNNVAYFTCEVDTAVIEDRLDALNGDVLINDLGLKNKELIDKLKKKEYKGEIYIYDYPTKRLTTSEIERQLRKLEIEHGIKIDCLVVDYIGIMKSNISGEKWDQIEEIGEQLRALAKVFSIPVLTAAQLNRGGNGKKVAGGSDLASSYALTGIVDGLLTICGSTEARDRGEITIRTSEFRNCPPASIRILSEYAKGRFFASSLGEEF